MNEDEATQLLMELFRSENQRPIEPDLIQQFTKLDPQGHFLKFWEWVTNVRDGEQAVWLINNTDVNRFYLATGFKLNLMQVDYSKLSEEALICFIGMGAHNFLILKRYSSWEDFKYPQEPLPRDFINEQIIKPRCSMPLEGYNMLILSIYLWWYFALKEAVRRAREHPELEAFLNYHTSTDTQIAELCQNLPPKGYQVPNQDQAWIKLEGTLKPRLKVTEGKYRDVLKSGEASTGESLLVGVNYWKSKAAEAAIAGLKGQLGNSLLSIVKNNLIDATRKAYRKHEVTESEEDASRRSDEDVTPFLDTIPSPEPPLEDMMDEDQIDVKDLGYDPDELTAGELLLLNELRDATSRGYERYSKQGLSLRQYWGKDYDRKIKMLERLEDKRKKP